MKRFPFAAAAFAVVSFSASTASAQAVRPITIGVSAGAAIPVGDLADVFKTGYNGTVSLGFVPIGSPIGFRVDGMYNKLGSKDEFDFPDLKIISGNANLVYSLPGTGISPYLIGGAGVYNFKADGSGSYSDSETDFGLNGGIGAAFPLSGFSAFVEARYHHVFTEGSATQFIPVTFGLRF
ncbi:MAG: outer membrane beta-barrel protein [Gemmatimonadaceae bacterium]